MTMPLPDRFTRGGLALAAAALALLAGCADMSGIASQAQLRDAPSVGLNAADADHNEINSRWWLLVFPCLLLAATLLSLNFLGDGLRDVFDPKRETAKI